MSHNVLYLSYDGMTDPLGQSQVLPYLCGLTKRGFIFHLISFEKKDRFEKYASHIQAICDENGIVWHPLSYTKNPPLLSTIYDVQRMKKLAHNLNKKFNFSIVHCRSYLSALVGLGMKKRFKTKFLFDMRGFWADERVDGNIWNIQQPIFKWVYRYFKKKEKQFFIHADHTVSLTYAGKEEICSWKGLGHLRTKIEVIPCCADLNKFNPNNIKEERRQYFFQELQLTNNNFILGYVGSIGTWYMLDEMLEYFKHLLKEKPNALFLFVTGEDESTILEKAKKIGISSDKFRVISVLHQDVATCISLFSASIFFIIPTFSKKASSPTKQGELMAMGIPIICNAGVGDTAKIVEEYDAGYALEGFSEEYFSRVDINFPYFNESKCKKGAEEFYSLTQGVDRYFSVYSSLTSHGV
jgi:glycosyltransferase involved in cell wall biosynthesis